jgi:HSP20 family protein
MLTRWNDFGRLGRLVNREQREPVEAFDFLRREMNRLFFDFENGGIADMELETGFPRVGLEDAGSTLVVRAEVPGLTEKDVELTLDNSTLTIKGQRREETPEGYSAHRKERGAYRVSRSVQLPTKVASEKTEALLKNGVLTVTLHKAEEAKSR